MGEVLPMPAFGDLFTDVRGGDRTMRVSYHEDRGVVVLSLWAGTVCRGSFRLAADEIGDLIAILGQIQTRAIPPADDASTPSHPGPEVTADSPTPAETGSVTLPEPPRHSGAPGTVIRSIVPRVA
jgi:hypothetical protein